MKRRSPVQTVTHKPESLRSRFYESVAKVLADARCNAYRAVNFAMVAAYWQVGRMIVEEEQRGKERAGYGEELINHLSERLVSDFGNGYSPRSLREFRQFYLAFAPDAIAKDGEMYRPNKIWRTACAKSITEFKTMGCDECAGLNPKLTWSHYRLLMRVAKPDARAYYMKEAAEQNWSVRALDRQINSLYFERLRMSRDRAPVVDEMKLKTAPLIVQPADFVKNEIERGKAMIVQEQATRYGLWA